jgi:hypothetical protein
MLSLPNRICKAIRSRGIDLMCNAGICYASIRAVSRFWCDTTRMNISGITWHGESIDDVEILRELPPELVRLLGDLNGFIIGNGTLHVRGASLIPDWHSLRAAWHGPSAFHALYDDVLENDIPFAEDQFGDQFLIRNGAILRLSAETGEIETYVDNLAVFLRRLNEDIEGFFNVSLRHTMEPGQLLLAYPPFVFRESSGGAALNPVRAGEVILFHADLAKKLRDVPEGGTIEFKLVE